MSKFDPPRGEVWFRFWVGVAGLGLLAVALWIRGIPSGPAIVEVIGIGGAFFGGTTLWAAWKLWKTR
jgi:hypothetical protein